ncbi:MAG: 3-hydroxyacyl-CoA dehydrogenase [Terriglobales bacterium]
MADRIPVGIVGAGAMGSGIAQVAAAAGHPVLIVDARAGAAAEAIAGVRAMFAKLAAKGKLSAQAAAAAASRLKPAESLAELAGAGLVIEAIVEQLEPKRRLFADLETIVDRECLLATNTSSLSLAAMAAALRTPARLVGMHFFNPAPLMELVEVVGSVATDEASLAAVEALARAWGKAPVLARATPGFIVNRVARPFYAEGLRLLAEQAADAATVDAVLREAGGFRMGPLELTDLIGQDVNFAVTRSVFAGFFHDPRFAPALVQQELVEAGWLGRKSGRGFYRYDADAPPPAPRSEAPEPAPDRIALTGHDRLAEALAARLQAGGVEVVLNPHLPTDLVLHIGDGRTAAALEALGASPGTWRQPTVVVDLALDYASATRLAIAASPRCLGPEPDSGCRRAIGALQAGGFAVSRMRDLPGLAVLRTVVMLANEAADAVHYGVASAADVDLAMRKGVNYPLGPLAWADRLGPARVLAALDHLAAFYGEDRYRASGLLRQVTAAGGRFHE